MKRFDYGITAGENRIGQVTGLAWTEVGGELLTIEAVALKGKGNIVRTGKFRRCDARVYFCRLVCGAFTR